MAGGLVMHSLDVLPVWERDGQPYVPSLDELSKGELCMAWCCVATISVFGDRRLFLLVFRDDEP
jgi:hypothetical protein